MAGGEGRRWQAVISLDPYERSWADQGLQDPLCVGVGKGGQDIVERVAHHY
jgi:hypothetical protein